ncbi:MAG: YkgJ family cysteine cluster protein [Proteocatella sp.]
MEVLTNELRYCFERKKMVKDYIDSLNKIYEKVSPGDCSGCGNCCSESVGASFVEAEVIFEALKNMDKVKREVILEKLMNYYFDIYDIRQKCPFLGEDKLCAIYEVRPLNCRLYGHWKKDEYNANLERLSFQNADISRVILEEYGYKVSDEYLGFAIEYCSKFKGEIFPLSLRNELYDELIVLDSKYFVKNKIIVAYEDKGIVEHIIDKLFSKQRIYTLKMDGKLSGKLRRRLIELAKYRIGAM